MKDRIHLSAPDVGPAEEEAVLRALRSGWVAPLGPEVDAFEAELAERCGRQHAVALSSGTAALHLGLLELGAGPGSVVVVPTMTFAATANAVVYTGAEPVFVDCEEATGNLDPDLLERALADLRGEGRRVAAVVPVDLLGRCADHDRIAPVCADAGVPVLVDAAESLASRYKGEPAGSYGVAAVLSFNGNKVMTTSGGGALVTDDRALADRVRYLSSQARQPAVHYEHSEVGYNYRLSNVLAALGRAQLGRLESMVERRRSIREAYRSLFASLPGVTIFHGEDDHDDNCWLTAILVDAAVTGWSAGELQSSLEVQGIESRPLWKPMHLQPVFEGSRRFLSGASEQLFEVGLALPSGSVLSDQQLSQIRAAVLEFRRIAGMTGSAPASVVSVGETARRSHGGSRS